MATISQLEQGIKVAQAQNKPEIVQKLRTAMQGMLSKGWYAAHAQQNYNAQGAIAQKLKQYGLQVMPASEVQGLDQGQLGDMRQRAIAEGTSAPLRFAEGVVHGAASPFIGAGQAIAHALPLSDKTTQAVDRRVAGNEQAFEAGPGSTASGTVGDVVGELLPYIYGGSALKAAGLVPEVSGALGKVGTLAAGGAAAGAVTPVTTDNGNFAEEKARQIGVGAAAAPALYGAGKAASAISRGARGLTRLATSGGRDQLANERLAKTLTSISPEVGGVTDVGSTIRQLESARPLVPGESVGAGQAIGGPRAVQMTRQFMNDASAGPVLADASNANNAARNRVLQKLAGTDEELESARQTRREAVQPYIDKHLTPSTPLTRWTQAAKPLDDVLASNARMPAADHEALSQARQIVAGVRGGTLQEDDAVTALSQLEEGATTKAARSAFQRAFQAIDKNMANPAKLLTFIARMRNTGPGARKNIRSALDSIASTIKESENTRGLVPLDVLDSVRQNLGDFLVSPAGKRATTQETKLLEPVRHQIIQTLQRRAPGYSDYLATYAKKSVPIRTMERVRSLVDENNPAGRNAGGDQVLSPSRLKAFLRQEARAKYRISPDAMKQIGAVLRSAERDALPNVKIGTKGSDTAANLKLPPLTGHITPFTSRLLGASGGALIGHALGIPAGYEAGGALGLVGGSMLSPTLDRLNADVVRRMATKAADSQTAAQVLRDANKPQSKLLNLLAYPLPYTEKPRMLLGNGQP